MLDESVAKKTRPPGAQDPIEKWLAPSLVQGLDAAGVRDLGQLCRLIEQDGPRWYRGIAGIGATGARKILEWLQSHEPDLRHVDLTGPAWYQVAAPSSADTCMPGTCAADVTGSISTVASVVKSFASSGHWSSGLQGVNRAQGPNALGVDHDLEAVERWLASYRDAGKVRTYEAYRREIVRFLLWCRSEQHVELSDVTLEHVQEYQRFLTAIPGRYITKLRVSVGDVRWRPWRGQLDPRSQNYALQVVAQCFSELQANRYLTFNPCASLKRQSARARVMDTTRSLSDSDIKWVEKVLEGLPRSEAVFSNLSLHQMHKVALGRRTRLILSLLTGTGMRLNELATADLSCLRKALVDGKEHEDLFALEIVGKGGKARLVMIKTQVVSLIRRHHADVMAMLEAVGGSSAPARIAALKRRPPLICAIVSPPGSSSRGIDDESEMANDNLALSRSALYKTLKTFFKAATRGHIKQIEKSLLARSSTRRHDLECELEQELQMWRRRASMSTHWLRHTFAHQVLRTNPSDQGLKLAQELLGHASIATTAEYLRQDEADRARAVERLPVLGV